MVYGYSGKILRVNLSTSNIKEEPLDMEWIKKLLGGCGYAAKILFEEVGPEVDPLSPENRLIIMTGPLIGSGFMCGNKIQAVARSPLTGFWGDAVFSPRFGLELKKAGYDGIVIQGASEKPEFLWIKDGEVEIKDASSVWGKDNYETFESLKKEIGEENVRIISIGPSGEKQLRMACIESDDGRAAGRTGMGAVMGSKNLKAIAVRGTRDIAVAKPEEFMEFVTEFHERMKGPATQKYRTLGTPVNV